MNARQFVAAATVAEGRWQRRPVAAALVRLTVIGAPVLLGVSLAVLVARVGPGPVPVRWTLALLLAPLTAYGVLVLARRLLPLATLLDLPLLFPDRAPSRLRVALQAGSTRELTGAMAGDRGKDAAAAAREVVTLLGLLARHSPGTRRHTERVRAYTDLVAEGLRLSARDRDLLRWAALLHDVGKLKVDSTVLDKPAALDADEWDAVRRHPHAGATLAAGLAPFLGPWFDTIGQHHERWDGGGYPAALAGEQICLGARIVAVADAFEVMTGDRPYQVAGTAAAAREELVACSGDQFDPKVVRALLDVSVSRLERVAGPLAFLVGVPLVAGPDLVGLADGAVLHPAAHTHALVTPTGHDLAGSAPPTGHEHDGGAGAAADPR